LDRGAEVRSRCRQQQSARHHAGAISFVIRARVSPIFGTGSPNPVQIVSGERHNCFTTVASFTWKRQINASAVTKSAGALLGAALVVACAPVRTFDKLATSDRVLFSACTPSLMTAVCGKDGDDAAKARCIASRGKAFGKLHSAKMRRSWLIANGCPQATVDSPPTPSAEVAAAAVPPPAPEPDPATSTPSAPAEVEPTAATPPPAAEAEPIAATPPPAPKPQPSPEPRRAQTLVATAPPPLPSLLKATRPRPRSIDVFDLRLEAAAVTALPPPKPPAAVPPPAPKAEPAAPSPPSPPRHVAAAPPPPRPEPAPEPVAAPAPTPEPVAPKARPTGPPARAFSDKERPEMREQRLRDILLAHRSEMKACVDRQLKLLPSLRAEGTLVIDVDATGAVPRSELLGTDLAGTPLEDCLRTLASRWRFPSSGRAYRIDAPVKVWGTVTAR
jgi:hypothetical protein